MAPIDSLNLHKNFRMPELITSLQNNKIKQVVRLRKPSERKSENLFIIEGLREIIMASEFGYTLQSLFFCASLTKHLPNFQLFENLPKNIQIFEVTETVFKKIAYRDQSDGLLALAVPRYLKISEIHLSPVPLIIVLETVEKPGNLGAILRTADAASADAVIVCDRRTDIYNPNVIRSSLGCLFPMQVVTCSSEEALDFLKKNRITTFAAYLQTDSFYHKADFTVPSAIVMGTEATGLSDFWIEHCDRHIKIPMGGKIDSLNVSVSTAIIVFEALRQRSFGIE
jgi:RNA methyltransferase, TrmH family